MSRQAVSRLTSYNVCYTKLLRVHLAQLGHHVVQDLDVAAEQDLLAHRITSYNVCYTKLLRFRKLGLQMITCTAGICKIGKEGSELLLLNQSLETSLKGVFAIGGAISPVYMGVFEEGTIKENKHPNLIYTAVRDGVAVADEIVRRLKA